jgi:plastocyanin
MRFHPGILIIHVGDQVVWTQYAANEAHTVTFVPAGMAIPDFPSPQSVTPSGNATSYDGTGYFNSGLLLPGQSYVLTFTKSGMYTYLCILHDDLNMVGYVEVLPSVTSTTTVVQPSAGTDVVAWVALVMAVVLGGMALALARRRFR